MPRSRRPLALAVLAVVALAAGGSYWAHYRFPAQQASDVKDAVREARQRIPGIQAEYGFDGCHPLRIGCGAASATMTVGIQWASQYQVTPEEVLTAAQWELPAILGSINLRQTGQVTRDPRTGWASFTADAAFPDGTIGEATCGILTDQASDPDAASQLAADTPGLPSGISCQITVPR